MPNPKEPSPAELALLAQLELLQRLAQVGVFGCEFEHLATVDAQPVPMNGWASVVPALLGRDHAVNFNTVFILSGAEQLQSACARGIGEWQHEMMIAALNGAHRCLRFVVHVDYHSDGRPLKLTGSVRDVTDEKIVSEELQELKQRLDLVMKAAHASVFRVQIADDRESPFQYLTTQHQNWMLNAGPLYGTTDDIVRTPMDAIKYVHPDDLDGVMQIQQQAISSSAPNYTVEYRVIWPDQSVHWIYSKGDIQRDSDGVAHTFTGIQFDITERKEAEERIAHMAGHDALTGLPNRALCSENLRRALAAARRYRRRFALMFIDLDRFKVINDTLGHDAGDKLIQEMARRFTTTLRACEMVARLGGDEFVVLVEEIHEPEEAAVVARKLLSTAIAPMMLGGQECRVTASIGISLYPRDGADEAALMKHADIAMYMAKEEGKNTFKFYSEEMRTQSLERLSLEGHLRGALEREEFTLQYQPKIDLTSGAITGVEALLRWNNPALGSVSPVRFIPVAEETGLIVPIGKWVLNTACQQGAQWRRAGLPPVPIAINVSSRQFADDRLYEDIADALRTTGLPPEMLEIELTEGMVMRDIERAVKILRAIKQLGVRIAIDDFGTGYSSLAQIRRFPIDTLKVDRSFVRNIQDDREGQAITDAIITMAKSLSLTVVAEGVETPAEAHFLRDRACDQMQGYYFSKPINSDAFAELLHNHTQTPVGDKSTAA
jgi:diguanylate cyclase (GGDEF)-like protein/PAS domain S-box-containing protein